MTKLKGKQLDREIEKELILMLDEGYESSPITQSSVAKRLIKKGFISYRSTINTRKELVEQFAEEQKSKVKGFLGDAVRGAVSGNKADLISANARLRNEVKESKTQVHLNTKALLNIIKAVRAQTTVRNIERVLSPYLIRELNQGLTENHD
ncbi:hypothetical protein BCV12_006955 [Vibrio cyclitrophicus]|uniref:hypothetical protein n=1 Tax=Vibrio cyclitrophicus TaxID=47951 RepID=UPI001056BE25|nr:hypothetical protein [Vibrio cyclitrophicus]